jgi:hypothetical protein
LSSISIFSETIGDAVITNLFYAGSVGVGVFGIRVIHDIERELFGLPSTDSPPTTNEFDSSLFDEVLSYLESAGTTSTTTSTAYPTTIAYKIGFGRIREQIALVRYIQRCPEGYLEQIFKFIQEEIPGSSVTREFLMEEREKIFSLVTVPGWVHSAILSLRLQILSEEYSFHAIVGAVSSFAPNNSHLVRNTEHFRQIVYVWIQYGLRSQSHAFAVPAFVAVVGEYSVSYRLAPVQFNQFLDQYSLALLDRL